MKEGPWRDTELRDLVRDAELYQQRRQQLARSIERCCLACEDRGIVALDRDRRGDNKELPWPYVLMLAE